MRSRDDVEGPRVLAETFNGVRPRRPSTLPGSASNSLPHDGSPAGAVAPYACASRRSSSRTLAAPAGRPRTSSERQGCEFESLLRSNF